MLPSYADLTFVLSFIAVVVVGATRALNGDGDLASHLRFGELILSGRSIPTAYPFTWGPEGLPFLAHAWLGEVVLAWTHGAFGLAGIVVFTATLVALAMSLFVRFLLTRGVRGWVVFVATGLVLAVSSIHWLGRSHLFTWVGAVTLMNMLVARRPVPWWAYSLLFALWANLHGGFLFGILFLGAFAAGALAHHFLGRNEVPLRSASALLIPLAAAVLGTLINPRGPLRYVEIASLLGDSSIINQINEFASPDFHAAAGRVLLLMLLTAMVALCTRPLMPWAWISVLLMATAQALFAVRNIPLFALSVFPLVLVQLAKTMPWIGDRTATDVTEVPPNPIAFVRSRGLGVFPLVLLVGALFCASQGGRLGSATLLPNSFSAGAFPVEAVDRAQEAGLEGRLFSVLGWGGYVIYAWPEQQPFLDGLIYSGELLGTQATIEDADPNWDTELDRIDAGLVLVPSQERLAYALNAHPAWRLWHCDAVSTLFVRAASAAGQASRTPVNAACPLDDG